MDVEELRTYALQKDDAEEALPFGPDVWVCKVLGKMFILVSLDTFPLQLNLKCDPAIAIELRERYPNCILPGYHMNKKHWNTILINGMLAKQQILQMIDDSYTLVRGKK